MKKRLLFISIVLLVSSCGRKTNQNQFDEAIAKAKMAEIEALKSSNQHLENEFRLTAILQQIYIYEEAYEERGKVANSENMTKLVDAYFDGELSKVDSLLKITGLEAKELYERRTGKSISQ